MSFSATDWAWKQRCSSGIAKSVLVYLSKVSNEAGDNIYPSVGRIAFDTQHALGAVRKALAELKDAGLIDITPNFDQKSGRQTSNRYSLTMRDVPPLSNPTGRKSENLDAGLSHPPSSPPTASATPPPAASAIPPLSYPIPESSNEDSRRKKEGTLFQSDDTAEPIVDELQPEIVSELFGEGLISLRHMTGRSEKACRSLIGKWRRDTQDDSAQVMRAIRRARHMHPADPIEFITGMLRPKKSLADRAFAILEASGALS